MNAATDTLATTDTICAAITEELTEQGCPSYETRSWEYVLDEPTADYDSSEDGSASWWWAGTIYNEDGDEVATFSLPDWYVEAVEISWS